MKRQLKLQDFTTIIFDMDGVVIDSGPLWKQANIKFFGQFGITKIAIVTGADHFLLEKIKSILNLEDYFGKHMYSVEDVNFVSKPDPATFLLAAEKLNSKPEECIVIEDAQLGIQAAKAGGMHAIGFKNGEDTVFPEADLVVNEYTELANALPF